jgi:hypothetical protein
MCPDRIDPIESNQAADQVHRWLEYRFRLIGCAPRRGEADVRIWISEESLQPFRRPVRVVETQVRDCRVSNSFRFVREQSFRIRFVVSRECVHCVQSLFSHERRRVLKKRQQLTRKISTTRKLQQAE